MPDAEPLFTGFAGERRVGAGPLAAVAAALKTAIDAGETGQILVFDDADARTIEIDFRGAHEDVATSVRRALLARRAQSAPASDEARRGPGRPKLGVLAREVTLLPRHWEWLAGQPGGASVALRRLVEEASRDREGRQRRRLAQEAAYRFLSSLAGDRPHFEEALRALFAGEARRFADLIAGWPEDVRDYALQLTAGAFER